MRFFLFCLFSGILGEIGADLSDLRRCADKDCNAVLSTGKTLIKYQGRELGLLSFEPNREVKIFSKDAGSNPNLWGVVIDGKRGYMNKQHIQELQIIKPNKDINQFVPLEQFYLNQMNPGGANQGPPPPGQPHERSHTPPPPPSPKTQLPSGGMKTQLPTGARKHSPSTPQNFEVVDGTTIYLDPGLPSINESPPLENITPSEIQPTMTGQAVGGAPTAVVDGIEPSLPDVAPEIESSVRSPDFQDLQQTPPTNTEPVLTGNTVGGPAPTEPSSGGPAAPVDTTEPVKGEIVRDVPRTVTPTDPNNQPSLAAEVNLQDGALTTDADLKKQVEVDQTKKVENAGTLDQQNAGVTEPFDDNTNDEEEENDEEVADYDNYDDYDEAFADLNEILEQNEKDAKAQEKVEVKVEEDKAVEEPKVETTETKDIIGDNDQYTVVNERVDLNKANHEPVETKSSDHQAQETLKLSEESVNEPVDTIKEPVNTVEEPVVVEPVAMNDEPVTVQPPTEVPTTSENIEEDAIAPKDDSNQEVVINPEAQLPEMTLPLPADDNIDIDVVNVNTANQILEDEKPTEVETPDDSNPQKAEEDGGFFTGWFGSGAGSEELVTDSTILNPEGSTFDPSSYPVPENPYKDGQPPVLAEPEVSSAPSDLDIDTESLFKDLAADLNLDSADSEPAVTVDPVDPYNQQFTQQGDQYTQPSEQYAQPADQYTRPAEQYVQPADQYAQPADQYAQPADQYAQPADQYAQPADQYAQPADQYAQPADQEVDPNYQAVHQPGVGDLSHADTPITGYLMEYMPGWLHEAAHHAGGINGDRAVLLVIIAFTLIFVHLINICIGKSSREKPLIAKLAELDSKLFQSASEIQLLRKEAVEKGSNSEDTVSTAQVRELEIELEQANIEKDRLQNHSREIQTRCSQFQEEIYRAVAIQQEKEKETELAVQEKELALEEARQAQEMVEEMISSQNNNQSDAKLIELVQKLQQQLESQQGVLKQYEPKLKKKEKETKELQKEMKQLRVDKANAELAKDKIEAKMQELNNEVEEKAKLLEEKEKNEEEWRSLSDLLQTQLDEKSEEYSTLEADTATMKSRLSIYQNELEEKEEEVEVLQETINQLNKIKGKKSIGDEDGSEGWEVDNDEDANGWEVEEDIHVEDESDTEEGNNDIGEVAKFKVSAKRASKVAKKLQEEIKNVETNLSEAKSKLDEREKECEQLRSARDETVSELVETNRKLEVLEHFFNKKEAELQKQLGLQSARFGDMSSNADTTSKQLLSVSEELETTQSAMKVLKCELEEQERSLKAAVAVQEKKAHENWVAARQAERKLGDLQTEISTLRNRLTVVESRAQNLEQEKQDLQQTIQTIQQGKPEGSTAGSTTGHPDHASDTNSITDPASLPPLPGLPVGLGGPATLPPLPGLGGLPSMPPMMLPTVFPQMIDTRPPTLGRISPSRERDASFRSSRGDYSPPRGRDYSPTSRSERRGGGGGRRGSPMRRPSPTRSDRGYYRDRDSSTDRSYRHEDRYDRRSNRDADYDRYYDRRSTGRNDTEEVEYERRGSREYGGTDRTLADDFGYDRRGSHGKASRTDYLDLKPGGPKTSSPLEPQSRNKYMA